jgi:ABC-type dipeptide/oligopeptide/nickel transport system permease subunit
MILATLILPPAVILLNQCIVTKDGLSSLSFIYVLLAVLYFLILVLLFLIVLITGSYISDQKNKKMNEHVLQSKMSLWGFLLVFLGLSPLSLIILKPLLLFVQNQLGVEWLQICVLSDLNHEIIGFLKSAVLSEDLRNFEYKTYYNYLITGITHAVLHSYYISLIAVMISLIACFLAVLFAIATRMRTLGFIFKIPNDVLSQFVQLIESVPGILLLCIFLPIVTKLIYKLKVLPESDLFIYVGITIGISCTPLIFRLVNDRIRQFEPYDFIINAKIHGVAPSKIIWYHIIWKNSFNQLLTEFIYIWGLALILETGLCILASCGSLQLPIIGGLHFSLGYLLSTEDNRKIFTELFGIGPLEFIKIIVPLLLFISTTSGLFFIQQGFQNEKDDDIRTVSEENLSRFDRILNRAYFKK